MIKCCICGLSFRRITNSHLNKRHGISSFEFSKRYPNADRGIVSWNKGKTKYTHPGLMRLSQGLTRQKKWNFSNWQKKNKKRSRREKERKLEKDANLAELVGIILGDGNLTNYPRTEALRVVCNSEQIYYINHVVALIQKIFNKRPAVYKRKSQKATDIILYKCNLSGKLGIPTGNKIKNDVGAPGWIKEKKEYIIHCLKGLFETDGCFQKDPSNYAQYIELKNLCSRIKIDTYYMLISLGYNPQISTKYVRLAKREEVYSFKKLIKYKEY